MPTLNPSPEQAIREQYATSKTKYSHQPTQRAGEEGSVDVWEGKLCKLLATFQHPVPTGVKHERRQNYCAQALRHDVFC